MVQSFNTGAPVPWFALISPAECKNISGGAGLGMAVFSEAIDAARMVDLAFDNYSRDLYLGQKKVFYNKRLTQSFIGEDGKERTITPDELRQQQFFMLPGEDDPDAAAQWHEYNPDLRVDDNSQAVQDALDYFSFKCGLGTHHYQFQAGNITTATQYTGDRQDMVQHANRHQINIESALIQIFRALLWAGKTIIGAKVNPDADIRISFDDSYVIDTESRLGNMKDDAVHGFIPRYKYLMERYGYDEETAKKMVAEADAETRNKDPLDFGGEE
jgi:A118 family predicted phage portal protein